MVNYLLIFTGTGRNFHSNSECQFGQIFYNFLFFKAFSPIKIQQIELEASWEVANWTTDTSCSSVVSLTNLYTGWK